MARRIRSDCTVKSLEKRIGAFGCLRHPSGRKMRKDKTVKSIRKGK